MTRNPKKSVVAKIFVKKEIIEIESDIDEVGGRMLALCGAENASGDDALAKNPNKSDVAKTLVTKEIIEIESDTDTDEVGGRMLAPFGEVNVPGDDTLAKDGETNRTNDLEYKNYLARFNEIGNLYLLEDNARGSSPMRLMYHTDNEASDKSKDRAVKTEKSRAGRKAKSPTISSVSKRLKTENGRVNHKSVSRTVFRTKETQQKKEDARRGRKISVAKNTIELKPKSYVRDTQQKKGDAQRGRKNSVAKKNVKLKPTRDAILRNSIAICKSDRQVKPVKDVVSLSDPDIIAVSDHPFSDGSKSPFEATKDGKVIDLEDGIEPDDIFNSLFSKKLMEILRKPYDKEEFSKLSNEASLKRPLTRSRQLRDGREIEYDVDDQLAPSYLEKYTDFDKKYSRYDEKDLPRALNLLRGFFFYLENIVLEGAFKPWLHEKRLTNVCFDARLLVDAKILHATSNAAPHSS